MDEKLLTLPWQIQVSLGAGYAAYMVAYTGIRDYHKAIDTAFRAISFGLIAAAALTVLPPNNPLFSGSVAFAAAVAGGVIWRIFGGAAFQKSLRFLSISAADDAPSAWAMLQGDTKHAITQIAAYLDDGTWVRCDDTWQFRASPFGPCVIGPNGDLALYVTAVEEADGSVVQAPAVSSEGWGEQLTYVPAARIRQVVFRYLKRPSRLKRTLTIFRRRRRQDLQESIVD